MPKTIIAPIVTVLVLFLQAFGIHIGDDVASQITEWVVSGISLGITVWGIFKNHKDKGEV
jgi:hypothetical protein